MAAASKTAIKHADAVVMSAFGSCNSKTGRMDIQGKCKLADGSYKTIGILHLYQQDSFNFEEKVWKALLEKIKAEAGTYTTGEIVALRDDMLAAERIAI